MIIKNNIVPYSIHVEENILQDLKIRLQQTRWPDEADGVGWEYGIPLTVTNELAQYWKNSFNWRKAEQGINKFSQYRTIIDGHNLHFIHVRSSKKEAIPILLLHGWPSSIVEYLDIIEPLTNGNNTDDLTFHVVIPTLPGFGFSGPADHWNDTRAAEAFAELMTRLDYQNYVVHGEDTGAIIARKMGLLSAKKPKAIHVTQLFDSHATYETADVNNAYEKKALEQGARYNYELSAYALLQSTKPQTLTYALNDSPAGLLAWIAERFHDWTDPNFDCLETINKDKLLTNVMVYWLNQTIGSSVRYYKEGSSAWGEKLDASLTPTAVFSMPEDIGIPIQRLAEKNNHIFHWTNAQQGGHFAGFEVPDLLVKDLRESFSLLYKCNNVAK